MNLTRNKKKAKKVYRQSVVLTEEMKELLDEYCTSEDMPKSNFIRKAIFKEIAAQGVYWAKKITW